MQKSQDIKVKNGSEILNFIKKLQLVFWSIRNNFCAKCNKKFDSYYEFQEHIMRHDK